MQLVTTAKVDFADAEYEDIIVTVLASNRQYEKADKSAFAIRAADIERVDPSPLGAKGWRSPAPVTGQRLHSG